MFTLDLFNTRYEKQLHEGAVDREEQNRWQAHQRGEQDFKRREQNAGLGDEDFGTYSIWTQGTKDAEPKKIQTKQCSMNAVRQHAENIKQKYPSLRVWWQAHHLGNSRFEVDECMGYGGLAGEELNEFAPGQGGSSGNYFQALASAWYNGAFDSGNLQKGIKSKEDVERLLQRGVVCPDGVTRKFNIDYNSDFDGVVIFSDDYYEHGDHDETDSRTGQPFGPYDYMEFGDDDLDESAKWRDPKYKGQLYTQEKPDYRDTREYDRARWDPKPKGYPGRKELAGGSEYSDPDPLTRGFGRSGIKHSILDRGKRKGLPSRDQITSLKGSIRDAHGQHTEPNLPEQDESNGLPTVHRIGLTVTDPNHPMVSKRGETVQKTVRVKGDDREKAINSAIAHLRRKGYKVHDHHYIGTVDQGVAEGFEHNSQDLADVADWMQTTPDKLSVEVRQEPIEKFIKQIREMYGTYDEFPKDEERTNRILKLLRRGANPLPIYVEAGDPHLFVMEGRHRMVAFWLAEMKTIPVAYVSIKGQQVVAEGLSEMDKSQTPPGRDGSNDPDAGKKEYTAKTITPKKAAKDAVKILNKVFNKKKGVAEGSLNEFAIPSGNDGDSGRWYNDDELADIIGDDWFEDFDVSNDGFNIDAYGEKAKKNLVGYANSWFDDKGYDVHVMGVEHNDVDHDLQWYIVGSFHNPRFANEGVAEDNLNELDTFAPVTTYVRLANGTYVAANWRRNQNLSTASNSASFIDIKPLAPAAAKQLGLDQRLNDPEKKYTGAATISSGGPIQASGPLADRTINVVDIRDPKAAKDSGVPDTLFGKIAQWAQQQSQKQPGVAEGVMYGAENLNVGDNVVISGDVNLKGATGVIDSFGRDKRFVVVDLYNHGRHSFHSSDVSANDYDNDEHNDLDETRKGQVPMTLKPGETDNLEPEDSTGFKKLPAYQQGQAAQQKAGKQLIQKSPYTYQSDQDWAYRNGAADAQRQAMFANFGGTKPLTATEGEQQPGADYRDPKEVDYDAIGHDDMVARVKKLAGLGPMKTVYDPARRQYRNMPTAQQPKK